MDISPSREENPMDAATTASPWANYKLSAGMLEHFARAVDIAWDHVTTQSDAWRFGYCSSAVITMAGLLERIDAAAVSPEIDDAVSLARCATTDEIAAWLIAHGKAPAGDVALVREFGWAHGIGALCGYVYRLNYTLRVRTGQLPL